MKYKVTGKKQIYVSILFFIVLFLEDLVNCLSFIREMSML